MPRGTRLPDDAAYATPMTYTLRSTNPNGTIAYHGRATAQQLDEAA